MTISESDQTYFILREILIHDTDQFIPHLKSAIEKGYDVNHLPTKVYINLYYDPEQDPSCYSAFLSEIMYYFVVPDKINTQQLLKIIDYILLNGGDVNLPDKRRMFPLHYACIYCPPLTQKLLDTGADPNVINEDGYTPLTLSCLLYITASEGTEIHNLRNIYTLLQANAATKYMEEFLAQYPHDKLDVSEQKRFSELSKILKMFVQQSNELDNKARTPLFEYDL